ncbi:uncharacterized protein DEA37_0011419 [Paragonimus westermani]|uniref:BED-type domain-containing protein n=1 Tax=Paragonimus westermani TaxID=34504 RepID=A0A5J4P1U8_9TREM|nr:uncharacterized protein DEA37_0011419 [Paragonimus westermani]
MSANRTENLKQEGAVINSLSKQARNNLPAAPNIYHPGENISSGSYNTSGTNHSHTLEHHHRVTPNPELNQQPKLKSAAQYRTNRKSQPVRSYACFTPLPTRYPPRWGTKPGAKKSFVWKYFFHPELSMGLRDLAHTQCTLCDSQLAFNTSGTTTTMLNHLKSRHAEVVEQEQQRLHQHQQFQQQQQQQHNQRKQTYQQSTIPSASLIGKISQSYLREGITEQPFSHLWLRNQHVYSRTGTIRRGHRGRPPGSWRRVHQISRPIIQSPKDERQQPGGTQSYQMTPRSTRTVVSSVSH